MDTFNKSFNYTVVAGDTLWRLSQRFGTTVVDIRRLNGLSGDLLNIGQVLKIPSNRIVALTFDDGPRRGTSRLLDIIERCKVRATFFFLGDLLEQGKETVARAACLGNEVAGHTWSHHDMTQLNAFEIAETISKTSAAIKSIVGFSPRIYRPPFGAVNYKVRRVSAELGYSIVNWSLDTLDWRYRDADIIYNTIMNNARNGDIILLHDIHETTVDAMERVIPSLIAKGFQLVTASELLTHKYGELTPGTIYGRSRSLV